MVEGTVVKVIKGPGLPDPSLVGGIGRIVGRFKNDPIVSLKVRPNLRKGSCWCIPESCLKVIDDVSVKKTGKVAWSNYFSSFIKCTLYKSDEEWFFVLVDEHGNERSRTVKARTNYSIFNWR